MNDNISGRMCIDGGYHDTVSYRRQRVDLLARPYQQAIMDGDGE